MNDLQRIHISPFPGVAEIKRKITILGRNEDYKGRTVTLICGIEHFDVDGNRLVAFHSLERDPFILIASDESKVNAQTGALVFPDELGNIPEDSVGQYTWLKSAVENGANPFDITIAAVQEADALKRFT